MIFDGENKPTEEELKREEKRVKLLAEDVQRDYERRREERRKLESQWLLNMNFLKGEQYCSALPNGGIVEEDKRFYWQTHRVFNHIAPMIDARLSKLERMRPTLKIKPFSSEENDVKVANLSTGILQSVREKTGLDTVVDRVTLWSETCGTGFYKITWDVNGGRQVGVGENDEPIYEGEVSVSAVSPFEIYPDDLDTEDLGGQQSIIHAQTVPTGYVYDVFGIAVTGKTLEELKSYGNGVSSRAFDGVSEKKADYTVLIERYIRPNATFPDGKLEIACDGKLLYEGKLPYLNDEKGRRTFPFVKQESVPVANSFFGMSVVERLIPIQRAYNAVRNRKHELLNRIAMGVLCVEDGAVDVDELADEGVSPGKILVYRQGGKAPEIMNFGGVPSEFAREEEWLEKEFSLVAGVSDLSKSTIPTQVTSATGLKLLIGQNDSKLSVTVEKLSFALKEVGRQILRLYKEFAGSSRVVTMTGENKRMQVRYFEASDLSASDILFETQDVVSPEEKQETVMALWNAGVLTDENGNVSKENKARVLDAFGFTAYESTKSLSDLHIVKAQDENVEMEQLDVEVESYDDHEIHIVEHTKYLLSDAFRESKNEKVKARILAHIEKHKNMN